ncbi:MAG TPA: hypothetical protein VN634_06315 [Candidatus Limnocylindrales bacterium]|nr:hypothetical protein [Candidatus Limnocylindrales bacterium]
MKKSFSVTLTLIAVFAFADLSVAGGKPDGATCHVHKSCQSKLCLRQQPTDKFGKCCDQQDCAEQNKQCGEIDNGCGIPIQCGDCDPGSNCVNNQCVAGTTTTTTTSTTTTSSTTTTTNIDGCGNHFCGTDSSPLCSETGGSGGFSDCYVFQNPDSTCGVCASNFECVTPNCTQTSDCAPGQVCAINSCCGAGGVCTNTCTPTPPSTSTTSTTTTSTTSTTSTTLGCIPTSGDCSLGGEACCETACQNTGSGSTGFQCVPCIGLFAPCTPGGVACCSGSCQFVEGSNSCNP